MQLYSATFSGLWLAHMFGDFVLQTERTLLSERRGEVRGYVTHGAVHYLLAMLSLTLFTQFHTPRLRTLAGIIGLAVVHVFSDYAKVFLARSRIDAGPVFLVDQAWHAATIGGAAWLIAPSGGSSLGQAMQWWEAEAPKLLPILTVYVGVIFGGGYLVRHLTRPLLDSVVQEGGPALKQLRNAGMYIGWLERFLVLSALVLQSPAAVGLILTAKSIVRFPELKDLRFAEYFLIGTLLSISIALLGGMIVMRSLHGSFALK